MEYQKIANLLDNASNQPSKFRTSNWVEINDESRRTYTGSSIKFKTTMLRSNLCDYADAYLLVNGRITITGAWNNDAARRADERDKGVTFKNCAPFVKCINRINNTEIDNAKDIGIVMPMYNLIEYRENYSKTSVSLWQYYKDDPNDNLTDSESFKYNPNDNLTDSESFKYKVKITGKTPDDGNTKDAEIIVLLKYLSNFWRTLEMPLINCEVSLELTWSKKLLILQAKENFK